MQLPHWPETVMDVIAKQAQQIDANYFRQQIEWLHIADSDIVYVIFRKK